MSHSRSTLASKQSVCQQPSQAQQQQHSHASQGACHSKHTSRLALNIARTSSKETGIGTKSNLLVSWFTVSRTWAETIILITQERWNTTASNAKIIIPWCLNDMYYWHICMLSDMVKSYIHIINIGQWNNHVCISQKLHKCFILCVFVVTIKSRVWNVIFATILIPLTGC